MEMEFDEYVGQEEIPIIVSILMISAFAFAVGGPVLATMVSSGLTVLCSVLCIVLMWTVPIPTIA